MKERVSDMNLSGIITTLPNRGEKAFALKVRKNARAMFERTQASLYYTLLTSGKLYEHLAEIDTSACDMAEYLIKEMARKQGVTEQLKAVDMIRWIELMNNIRSCVDEIVLNDIIIIHNRILPERELLSSDGGFLFRQVFKKLLSRECSRSGQVEKITKMWYNILTH